MDNQPQNDNSIVALREILFESLRSLKAGAKQEEIDLARARSEVAQTVINSVKVEIDFTRATGLQSGSGFIPVAAPSNPQKPALQNLRAKGLLPPEDEDRDTQTGTVSHPKRGVLVHRLK